MKINNLKAFTRASNVIENDKSLMNAECRKVALKDLEKVIAEYFDLCTPLSLDLENREGKIAVTLTFQADRVKNFYGLK